MIKLILEERGELQTVELDRDAITIGRTADNAVRVQDALSSRHHCKIEKTSEGWFVEDLKSRNGTTLNGQRLDGRRVLAVGDRIAIGESVVHFGAKIDRAAAAASGTKLKSQKISKPVSTRKARFALKCVEGRSVGKGFAIPGFPFTIGRKKGLGLVLEEEDVSSEHCMLVEDQAEVHVVDLNSEAGTFVSGKRVKGREKLPPNGILAIGKTKLRFKDLAAPGGTASDDDLVAAGRVTPERAAPAVQEVRDLAKLGEEEEDAARTPIGTPRLPKEKTGRRVKPVEAAPPPSIEADETGIATTEFRSVSIEPETGGGAGAAILLVLGVIALFAAALPVTHALFSHEDRDPGPADNLVQNWSFEDERDPLRGWKIEGEARLARVVTDGVLHGARALKLECQGGAAEGRAELRAEPQRVTAGKAVALHATVKTSGQAAAVLALEWLDQGAPDWKSFECSAIVEGASSWTDAGASLVVPERATHARVVAFTIPLAGGSGAAFFDRISLREEADPPAVATLQGAGLAVSASRRGVLKVSRPPQNQAPELPLARIWLSLAAPDGSRGDPLSSQPAWATATAAADPGDGGIFADGTILDTSSGCRVQAAVVVKPVGDALKIWWEIAKKDLAEKRVVRAVIEAPHLRDLSPVELQSQSGATTTLEKAFEKAKASFIRLDGIIEIAFGQGAGQSSLKTPPVALEAERQGDGVRLELAWVPEVKGDLRVAGFDLAKASSLAHGRVRELLNQAEAARKDGRLEEARQTYLRLSREFSHDAPVAARARREADQLAQQADRLLDSVTGAAQDAEELGLPELARAAHAWSDALAKAFPGAPQLGRASSAVARADERLAKKTDLARGAKAHELVLRAIRHREANRNRLARTIYEYVVASFPPDDPSVKDAKERLAAMPATGGRGASDEEGD